MDRNTLREFINTIWVYYTTHGRLFDWRNIDDPYKVVVSEIMLQQTQTNRVIEKYRRFIHAFPTFESLAHASRQEVLMYWQGLGYNRRGMYLQQIAQKVVAEFDGHLPQDPKILETFPGIGKATAGSICAFAFNLPTVFIETNIRSVYIHFFFGAKKDISDSDLFPLIEKTVDQDNPREWYYALMDYGVMLKKQVVNPSRKSKHHAKQSKFEGSDRQVRGMIIKILSSKQSGILCHDLYTTIPREKDRIDLALATLEKDGLIIREGDLVHL